MATGNLSKCLPITLQYEGGWSNHPKDPGGATMNGVIQRTYDAYRKRKKLPLRSVKFIEPDEKLEIYREGYWNTTACEGREHGEDLCVFDAAVNSGPGRALKWSSAVSAKHCAGWIKEYCAKRMGFLRGLGTFKTFGKGWSRRVAGIEAAAMKMHLLATGSAAAASVALKVEAEAADKAVVVKDKQAAAVGTGGAAYTGGAWYSDINWFVVGGLAAVAVVVVVLVVKSRSHQKERAAAYRAV